MKKVMFLLVVFLFSVSATAATVSLANVSYTGDGSVVDASGPGGASATHSGIQGDFSDIWKVTSTPASNQILNIATSTPTFGNFDAFYSLDNGSSWFDFSGESIIPGINESEFHTLTGNLISYLIKVVGSGISVGSSSYALAVQDTTLPSVPVPAAIFLFAPALLGFLSLRRKSAV